MTDANKISSTISGVSYTGNWSEIVEFGEQIMAALESVQNDYESSSDANTLTEQTISTCIQEFDEWRPRIDDKTETLSQKTAEKARVENSELMDSEKTIPDEIETATENAKNAAKSAKELNPDETQDNVKKTVSNTTQATDSLFRRGIQQIETFVYTHIMTALSPYYFDNKLINANLTEHTDTKYTLEVNISNQDFREPFCQKTETIILQNSRWHIDSPINSESVENIDGVSEKVNQKSTKETLDDI